MLLARACCCGMLPLKNGVQAISVFWILFGIVGFISLFSPTLDDLRALGLSGAVTFQIVFTVIDFLFQWSMSTVLLIATRDRTASTPTIHRRYTKIGYYMYATRYVIMFIYYIISFIGIIVILSNWDSMKESARQDWSKHSREDFEDVTNQHHSLFINYLVGLIIFFPAEAYFMWIVFSYKQQVMTQGSYEEYGNDSYELRT